MIGVCVINIRHSVSKRTLSILISFHGLFVKESILKKFTIHGYLYFTIKMIVSGDCQIVSKSWSHYVSDT